MPLFYTDEQAMLADTARPFLAKAAPIAAMRALRDAGDPAGFSRDLWKQFAEMGFAGILIDEAHGGLGLGHVEAGIVLEEIGRNLTMSPFLATSIGAVTALSGAAEELRRRWLPDIAAGQAVAALALEEAARHRPAKVQLSAERSGNGFRLTGEKRFVIHGHVADFLIVSARTSGEAEDKAGITLFLVERDAAGLSAQPERLLDASIAARLRFDGVVVDAGAVIGALDDGWDTLWRMLGAVRTGAAAELAGVGDGAMQMTLGYLKDRKQFGQPIGSFQALQHRAAHLYAEMEVARAAVLKAQQLLDAGDPAAERAVLVAKGMAGLAAGLAVQEGVQLHGGIGMTDEYDIGLYMKRWRVLDEAFGSSDYHTDQIACLAGY